MVSTSNRVSLSLVAALSVLGESEAFMLVRTAHMPSVLAAAPSSPASTNINNIVVDTSAPAETSRRSFITRSFSATLGAASVFDRPNAVTAADGDLASMLGQIREAQEQIKIIPNLIKSEKWDAVRAILIKPPLAYMWTSGGQSKLLKNYADAIGSELQNGDEIAALELREEVISHLRYLDMAVYNNVFNPIATEGTTGATKELIRSYYEDPINEWNALNSAIDALIGLSSL